LKFVIDFKVIKKNRLTTASTCQRYCHETCLSLRLASFAPMYASQVKQMLGVEMTTPKNPEYQMTGFDAYEAAWDTVSKHLWSVLGFNATEIEKILKKSA